MSIVEAFRRYLPASAGMLLFGYGVQGYGALMSLAFSPYVLKSIGAEAYGLVGVYLIVQAWFQLLDAGITPALSRESARFRGGKTTAGRLGSTIRGFELIVLALAIPILVTVPMISPELASSWVNRESLTVTEVATVFNLVAVILLMRWVSGIRRGILTGFEQHAVLYSVTATVSTLRYPCIVVYFSFVEPTVTNYFLYQLAISIFELVIMWLFSRKLIPAPDSTRLWDWLASLKYIAAFAINHGFLTAIWIVTMQIDKMVMTRALTLSEFGYVSLALAAASGVNLVTAPISQMVLPRLTRLNASEDLGAIESTYSRFTRALVFSLSGVTALFTLFGTEVMYAWTGDATIASKTGIVLSLYTLGNAAMCLCAFCYYIQFAHGQLKLHITGSILLMLTLFPLVYWATNRYGVTGTAVTWASLWCFYLLTWVTYTHSIYLRRKHWRWLLGDVARIAVPVALTAVILRVFVTLPQERLWSGLSLIAMAGLFYVVALLCSGQVRLREALKLGPAQSA